MVALMCECWFPTVPHTDRKISVVRLLCWSIRVLGVGCLKLHAVFPAGTSTPSFGQSAAGGPIPFGSQGTPLQGFNAVQFGEASIFFFFFFVFFFFLEVMPSWGFSRDVWLDV